MRQLIVFGAQAFAEICHYYFSKQSDYQVVAVTVDGAYIRESKFCGLPVVPFEELHQKFPSTVADMFVAVGHQKLNSQREAKVVQAESKGYTLAKFVSPKANVADDLVIGPNSMVMEYTSLQPFIRIGKNSIIWTETRMGFRCEVRDHCWVVSAIFGERVSIGDNSFVGLNATIAPKVNVAPSNVIGAGALVMSNTKEFEVYRGAVSKASRVPSHRLPNF